MELKLLIYDSNGGALKSSVVTFSQFELWIPNHVVNDWYLIVFLYYAKYWV